jgi:phage terminase large subunit-like protein
MGSNTDSEIQPGLVSSDLPDAFERQLQSWDMAFKNTKTSDYVVGQVMATCGGDRYLLAQTRDRMDFPSMLLAVRQMCETWPAVSLKLVEEKANGPAVVQSLRQAVAGFVEVNPEGGKISRAAFGARQN